MNRLLLHLLVSLVFTSHSALLEAQCISAVGVGSYSANGASFAQQQVFSCNFAGDYATVTVPAGIWRFETNIATDFITVTTTSNVVIDTGTSSVLIGFLSAQTVRMHIFANAACSTNFICHTSYVTQELTPVPQVSANDTFICDGFGPVTLTAANTFGDQTYWYTGSCASTPIDSGSSITVPITSTTTYYAANFFNNALSACGSLTINIVSNPVAGIANSQDVLCFGDSTGSITASVSAGTAPYTYSWSNGMTGITIDTLDTGSYTVTITDVFGCVDQTTTSLSQPTQLAGSTTILATPACAGQSTGSIEAAASGGVGPYSYSWTNNDTTAIADSLDAGPHGVTVTDGNGCMLSLLDTITAPTVVTVSLVSITDSILCFGDETGEITLTASGGLGQLAYLWSTSATDSSISQLGAGVYSATVTDQNGCNALFSDTIYGPDALSVEFNATDATCHDSEDGSIEAVVSGGTSPCGYTWSNSETTNLIIALDTGIYSLTVTDVNGCAFSSDTSIVFVNSDPIVDLDSAYVLCAGSEIDIDAANAGSSFEWSNGALTQTITVTDTGIFAVTVTDANGCSASDQTVVVEEDCLGIEEGDGLSSIRSYPNPTNGILYIQSNLPLRTDISLSILNAKGQLLQSEPMTEQLQTISLEGLSSGIYFLRITSSSIQKVERIILQ